MKFLDNLQRSARRVIAVVSGSSCLLALADFSIIERRGRALILIDPSLAVPLASEIEQFRWDLIGDGWEVTTQTGIRHLDVRNPQLISYPSYKSDQLKHKEQIRAHYLQAPADTNVCILLGHLTVPYSGTGAEDGHVNISAYDDHCGAWPADSFYGDMGGVDGEGTWLDQQTQACGLNRYYDNLPGDGIWDHNSLPGTNDSGKPGRRLDVAIGRIDFSAMTDFVGTALAGGATNEVAVEIELTRRYLLKARRFRNQTLKFTTGATGNQFGMGIHFQTLTNTFTGPGFSQVQQSLFLTKSARPYLFGFHSGAGANNYVHISYQSNPFGAYTHLIANETLKVNGAFIFLQGSKFADFQTWNPWTRNPAVRSSLMRGVLAAEDAALTASFKLVPNPDFERFAQNLHYGTVIQDSFLTPNYNSASVRTTYCLGDPTLHAFVATPPAKVAASRLKNGVRVTWKLPARLMAQVDRSIMDASTNLWGAWTPLTPGGVAGRFDDLTAPPGARIMYRVRSIESIAIGSRRGMTLSQGGFATVN